MSKSSNLNCLSITGSQSNPSPMAKTDTDFEDEILPTGTREERH